MTPKEKAEELYNKFYNTDFHGNSIKIRDLLTKQCALIAVDEVMQKTLWDKGEQKYWQEVKQEINNL